MQCRQRTYAVTAIEITFFFTAFVAATYAFGVYLFATIVPDIRAALGFGQDVVGLATGLTQAGLMTSALLSGMLATAIGAFRTVLLAVAMSSICLVAFAAIPNTGLMVVLVTVLGACAGSVWVPIVAVTQYAVPQHHQGKALGLMSSGTSFGVFVNGIIVPPVLASWSWRTVWLVVGLLSALLLAVAAIRLRSLIGFRPETTREKLAPGVKGYLRLITAPIPLLLTSILFLSGLGFVPYQTYLTSLLREDLGWSIDAASRVWSAIGIGGMLGGFLLGAISDRISVKWTLVIAYSLLLSAVCVVLFSENLVLIYASALIFGLNFYAVFGLAAAYIAKTFEARTTTILCGTTFVAVGCGSTIGNYLGGIIVEATKNFAITYAGIAGCAAILIIVSLVMPREPAHPTTDMPPGD